MPVPPGIYNIEISDQYLVNWENVNFGNCQGSIKGIKFNDLNANGVQDPGEPRISGWTIHLNGPGFACRPAITDFLGAYVFVDLPPGNYQVHEILQPGWMQTMPAPPGIYNVVIKAPVPPASNAMIEEINFGNYFPPVRDFGDAPEGATVYPWSGIVGEFPTCENAGVSGFICHAQSNPNNNSFFGPAVDFEPEGNAGNCPDFLPNLYDQDECQNDGDAGLIKPTAFTINEGVAVKCNEAPIIPLGSPGQFATWGDTGNIDISVTNNLADTAFVNLLIDWNQDGSWNSLGTPDPEHVLVNFPVPPAYSGLLSDLNPPGFTIGPDSLFVWARFSITQLPVLNTWDGSGNFLSGETEDYLFYIKPSPPEPPLIRNIQNVTIDPGQAECYDATQTITVAGDGTTFTIAAAGSAIMIAGQKIDYLPTTKVYSGGYLHGYITNDGQYCIPLKSTEITIAKTQPPQLELPVKTEHTTFFKVYPNPTTGTITLEVVGIAEKNELLVEIYGILGNRILQVLAGGKAKCDFQLAEQPKGLYIMHIVSGTEVATVKVVKQ